MSYPTTDMFVDFVKVFIL